MLRSDDPENKAQILRIRARNHFMRGNYSDALTHTIDGLHMLGVDVNPSPSRRESEALFEEVKNEILAVGFDEILSIPRARDARTDLAIALLNDAGANAYWSGGKGHSDVIGLTVGRAQVLVVTASTDGHLQTVRLALRAGMCPGTALGFFWALGGECSKLSVFVDPDDTSACSRCRAERTLPILRGPGEARSAPCRPVRIKS